MCGVSFAIWDVFFCWLVALWVLFNFGGRLSWNQFSWEKNVSLPMQLLHILRKHGLHFAANSDFVFCDRFNFQECGQANYYNLVGCCSYGCI